MLRCVVVRRIVSGPEAPRRGMGVTARQTRRARPDRWNQPAHSVASRMVAARMVAAHMGAAHMGASRLDAAHMGVCGPSDIAPGDRAGSAGATLRLSDTGLSDTSGRRTCCATLRDVSCDAAASGG